MDTTEKTTIKVKGNVKIDIWYDEQIRMFGAAYKDSKGNTLGEAEFAPTKEMALKWLKENGPKLEFEKTPANQDRDY